MAFIWVGRKCALDFRQETHRLCNRTDELFKIETESSVWWLYSHSNSNSNSNSNANPIWGGKWQKTNGNEGGKWSLPSYPSNGLSRPTPFLPRPSTCTSFLWFSFSCFLCLFVHVCGRIDASFPLYQNTFEWVDSSIHFLFFQSFPNPFFSFPFFYRNLRVVCILNCQKKRKTKEKKKLLLERFACLVCCRLWSTQPITVSFQFQFSPFIFFFGFSPFHLFVSMFVTTRVSLFNRQLIDFLTAPLVLSM